MSTADAPKQPANQKAWQALVDTQDKARKAMAEARATTPLQRLMRRIQDLRLCPLCKREECECWQPLADADKEHAALADLAPLHRQLVEALEAVAAVSRKSHDSVDWVKLEHNQRGEYRLAIEVIRLADAALDAARKAGLS